VVASGMRPSSASASRTAASGRARNNFFTDPEDLSQEWRRLLQRGCAPLPQPAPLRQLLRNRPHRGLQRRPTPSSTLPRRQPSAQLGDARDRRLLSPGSRTRPRPLSPQTRRGQGPRRSQAQPETAAVQRGLQTPRRRPTRSHRQQHRPTAVATGDSNDQTPEIWC